MRHSRPGARPCIKSLDRHLTGGEMIPLDQEALMGKFSQFKFNKLSEVEITRNCIS